LNVVNCYVNHFPCATMIFLWSFNKSQSKPLFHLSNWQPKPAAIMLPSQESMLAISIFLLKTCVQSAYDIFVTHFRKEQIMMTKERPNFNKQHNNRSEGRRKCYKHCLQYQTFNLLTRNTHEINVQW